MSSKKSSVNANGILTQKKAAATHAKNTASTTAANAMPPAFNPEYEEQKQEFMDDNIEAVAASSSSNPSHRVRQQQAPLRRDGMPPAHNLPQTTRLFQSKIQTFNNIPIATEVVPVPNEEETGGRVDNNRKNNVDGNNNDAIDDEDERERRQRKRRSKCYLVIGAIVVGAIGAGIGVTMSSNNENEDKAPVGTLDFLGRAVPIKCGLSSISGNTTTEPFFNVPSCGGVPAATNSVGNRGKWFSLFGDGSCVNLTTCDSNTDFDTRIRVFKGFTTGNRLDYCVAGNDDALDEPSMCPPDSLHSKTSFTAIAGFLYYIFVDGFGKDDNGNFVMTIVCGECPPPQATPQPTTQPSPQPTIQPAFKPTSNPTTNPSKQPIPQPTIPPNIIKGGPTINLPTFKIPTPTFTRPIQPVPTLPLPTYIRPPTVIYPTGPIAILTKTTEKGAP